MVGVSTLSCLFGNNRYMDIGNVSELQLDTTDNFSFSFWYSMGGGTTIFSKYNGTQGYRVFMNSSNGRIHWALSDASGNTTNVLTLLPYNFRNEFNSYYGVFTHVVVTHSNSGTGMAADNLKIYINGWQVETETVTEALAGSIDNSAPFQISGFNGNNSIYAGNIDEFAVYNKELTDEEILSLYDNHQPVNHTLTGPTGNLIGYWRMGEGATFPTIPDESVNSNDGTLSGSAAASTDIQGKFPIGPLNVIDPFGSISGGGGDIIIKKYLMRGIDTAGPYPSYHFWQVTGSPDLNGSSAGTLPFGGPLTNIVVVKEY